VTAPYYEDDTVTLHHGNALELIDREFALADCVVTDPPYGETSLTWDRWPSGWPTFMPTNSMWCFGSMRMFLNRGAEFDAAGWQLSQDIVWEKHNGSGFHADRFKRVHEHALHWYRGAWGDVYKDPQTTPDATARAVRRKSRPTHTGNIEASSYVSVDGGPRLMRSVQQVRSMHGSAIHPTEKPLGILEPLIAYACPVGGTVLDPFAGSGSTLDAARSTGRRAIGIEAREDYCEAIANRLSQGVLL
jgi:site-specific DNA-methyltransferase (adenine-specific)